MRKIRPQPRHNPNLVLEAVVENDHTLVFPARRLTVKSLEASTQAVKSDYEGMVANDPESP
jgi:hypothetical protein